MPRSTLARAVALVCLVLVAGLLGAVGWRLLEGRDGGAAIVGQVLTSGTPTVGGPFALTDQFGKRRTDAEFRGQHLLVYFGFTYCPDVCPTELQRMGAAIDLLGPAGERVTPVFITVDPTRDTVEQMRIYAANFHPRLVALTGSPEEIAAAAKAYRVYYAEAADDGAADYMMDHSSFVYLMGPDGRFLAHFPFGTEPEAMAETIRSHL